MQIFETVIRGVGGLLSAHLFAVGDLPVKGYSPPQDQARRAKAWDPLEAERKGGIKWRNGFTYDGQLLRLSYDLAKRLLPAFYTTTGLPYPRVNLRHGVPFYPNSPLQFDGEEGTCDIKYKHSDEITETCSAGAGSLVLEFTVLSRLTGDDRFEQLAKRAFWQVWARKSPLGLIGSGIDAESGAWIGPFTGIGAGIDSYFEYALKSHVLLSGADRHRSENLDWSFSQDPSGIFPLTEDENSADAFLMVWDEAHAAIKHHLLRGSTYQHPHYIQGDLFTGAARAVWIDSLSAYYPGLLTISGELEEAIEAHLLQTALWTRFSALPERWNMATGNIEGGLGWWVGRPEFIESTYYLYQATKDPWYLHVGEMVLRDIKRRCWTDCGWAGLQDVRTGEQNDRMESFFLGETAKYLILLFDAAHPLNHLDSSFVFTTEGHPLVIPPSGDTDQQQSVRAEPFYAVNDATCPAPPKAVPFSVSATAARSDIFHAASLARLHLMPDREAIETPLVEFSADHPSISLSDLQSPTNYTFFPWTLPPSLIPSHGTSSPMTARSTLDITFPLIGTHFLGPASLQRVNEGILIKSMSNLRLGMVQDAISVENGVSDVYRVQVINQLALGKDEKIFLPQDIISGVVNPTDPNFTRIRDPTFLDLVIDIPNPPVAAAASGNDQIPSPPPPTEEPDPSLLLSDQSSTAPLTNAVTSAFSSWLSTMSSILATSNPTDPPNGTRLSISAILPTGIGAAPLPDFEEAPPSTSPGPLPWHNIYITPYFFDACTTRFPQSVPKTHDILVLRRGGCSFSRKLQSIPSFPPSKTSLKLVVIVSDDEEDDGWLVRPLLEETQMTPGGLPRHRPIPMVMVGGGEVTMEALRSTNGIGIKRKWKVEAQGVAISNLLIV